MRVFLQAIFGQLLFTLYIYLRGRAVLPKRRRWRLLYTLFFAAEWALYFFGYFTHSELPDSVMVPILMICGTWYIASIYLVTGLLFFDLCRWIYRRRPGWFPAWITANALRLRRGAYLLLALFTVGLMIQGYHNVEDPRVKHVRITIPKSTPGRDSLKVVLMTDTPFGESIGKRNAQRFVALSNAEQPDMVVIAGDVIDYELRIAARERIEEDLRQLRAPLGVYITLGNHEYRANCIAKQRWLRRTGGTLLIDSVVQPDSTFTLVGRDDYTNRHRAALSHLLHGVDMRHPVIVADHQPKFREVAMNGCDLGLFGHTHAGQIWPFTWITKLAYAHTYGYFREGPTQCYISSAAPARLIASARALSSSYCISGSENLRAPANEAGDTMMSNP